MFLSVNFQPFIIFQPILAPPNTAGTTAKPITTNVFAPSITEPAEPTAKIVITKLEGTVIATAIAITIVISPADFAITTAIITVNNAIVAVVNVNRESNPATFPNFSTATKNTAMLKIIEDIKVAKNNSSIFIKPAKILIKKILNNDDNNAPINDKTGSRKITSMSNILSFNIFRLFDKFSNTFDSADNKKKPIGAVANTIIIAKIKITAVQAINTPALDITGNIPTLIARLMINTDRAIKISKQTEPRELTQLGILSSRFS